MALLPLLSSSMLGGCDPHQTAPESTSEGASPDGTSSTAGPSESDADSGASGVESETPSEDLPPLDCDRFPPPSDEDDDDENDDDEDDDHDDFVECPDGVVYGSLRLSEQSAVDALAKCRAIAGDLILEGPGVVSLAPLKRIECIGGDFDIYDLEEVGESGVTSLVGLERLRYVGGELQLTDMDTVTDLSSLSRLKRVLGGLNIYRFPKLTSLHGLAGLEQVGSLTLSGLGRVERLEGLGNLRSIDHRLDISELAITNLHGLGPLDLAGPTDVTFAFNPKLLSLDGYPVAAFESLDRLQVADNTALSDLSGLSELVELDALSIRRCHQLENLAGLEGAQRFGSLHLWRNNGLLSLAGLDGLISVVELSIGENAKLRDLAGLDTLAVVERLSIDGAGLQRIGPLPALESVRSVSITAAKDLSDFGRLTALFTFEALVVQGAGVNASMAQFTDLDSVDYLSIKLNEHMTVEDLPTVRQVARLSVVVNGSLDQTAAEAWGESVEVTEQRKIDGNKGVALPYDECPWLEDHTCDEHTGLCAAETDSPDCDFIPD